MQKTGDICETCRGRWEDQKLEPKVLQRIGTTEKHNVIVPVCEYCDGPALQIFNSQAA